MYQSFPAYEQFGEAFPSNDSGIVSPFPDYGCGSARDFHPTSVEIQLIIQNRNRFDNPKFSTKTLSFPPDS